MTSSCRSQAIRELAGKTSLPRLSIGVYELQIVLLKRYYELQCAEQEKLQIRYHKGFALHNCGAGYLGLGQKEVARRYITLAHIEDVISHGVDAGGNG